MVRHLTLNRDPARALPKVDFWRGRRVFITGHTGFKGGWLATWLHKLGAVVAGYALTPPTEPNFFTVCRVDEALAHTLGDVRKVSDLDRAIINFQPEIIFHLAAQPIVRASYTRPVDTFSTNVMGTVNLLNAVNQLAYNTVTLVVTSDKVYAETATSERHKESGALGGQDPYGASKACAELAAASFPMLSHHVVATARSGNVIGGGDWAEDRLVADFMRAVMNGKTFFIRNKDAIRPWQHVLDPLCGYLVAAEYLWANHPAARPSWNFGPDSSSEVSVMELAKRLCGIWAEGASFAVTQVTCAPREAPVLRLDSSKAKQELYWSPGWALDEALSRTSQWFKSFLNNADMKLFTLAQISDYGEE